MTMTFPVVVALSVFAVMVVMTVIIAVVSAVSTASSIETRADDGTNE